MHDSHERPTSGPTPPNASPSKPPRAQAGPAGDPFRVVHRTAALRARLHRRHVERDRRLHAELAVHGLGPVPRDDGPRHEAPFQAPDTEAAWSVAAYYDEPGLQHTPCFY